MKIIYLIFFIYTATDVFKEFFSNIFLNHLKNKVVFKKYKEGNMVDYIKYISYTKALPIYKAFFIPKAIMPIMLYILSDKLFISQTTYGINIQPIIESGYIWGIPASALLGLFNALNKFNNTKNIL